MNLVHSFTYIFYKFEVVDKKNGKIVMKWKHYNTITSFVPYKNIIIYPHIIHCFHEVFTTYPTYYLLPTN
jgi:hypothetical protein